MMIITMSINSQYVKVCCNLTPYTNNVERIRSTKKLLKKKKNKEQLKQKKE